MKREVSVSVIAVLVVTAAILSVYYLNLKTTGFAVFQQDSESAFNEGTYSNALYSANSSSVVLDTGSNASSGTYTSKVFDAGNASTWNNLTWQGSGVSFEIRGCSTSDCSDANFTSPSNLNSLGISTRYIQYRALFDSSNDSLAGVTLDYTAMAATSVSISQPSGTIDTWEDIGLQYTAFGTGLQCWYNVKDSSGVDVVANTTPAACANTTFDVGTDGDGDYTVSVFANGTSGFALDTKSFTIDTTSEEEEEESEETEEAPEVVPVQEIPAVQEAPTIGLTIGNLEAQEVIQGSSKNLGLQLQNTGTAALNGCKLIGDDSGWLEVSAEGVGIAPGTSAIPPFSVKVPETTPVGTYTLSLTIECAEATGSRSLTVNVAQKKIDFNITSVQRTRENRVSVDYVLTELAGEDQDLQIYFSIKDANGVEIANASQNRSLDANETDDFRTNLAINETLNGTMTLSATFNSQIFSSSVLEPITLGAPTGAAIFGGIGAGSFVIVIAVALILATVFFAARRMRQSGKILRNLSSKSKDE